jgi:hypothetical protein
MAVRDLQEGSARCLAISAASGISVVTPAVELTIRITAALDGVVVGTEFGE